MKKSVKVMITTITLFVIAGGMLYSGPNLVVSPQRQATAGQFWSDADLFIDPRGFSVPEFDNIFTLISFDSSQMAKLGFAARFGPLYFGLYYGGDMLNMVPHNYTERTAGDGFFSEGKKMKVYTALPGYLGGNLPNNNLSLLFGFADMGFRLSCKSTYWNRVLNEDFLAEANYYKSFIDERGDINPELAWGMARDLVPGLGIKPHVYISLNFFRDYQKFERYTSADVIQEDVTKSNNVTTLDITAAMGTIKIVNNDAFEFGVDLWYNFAMPIYDNEYMYTEGTERKIAKGYKGLYSAAGSFAGLSETSHKVTPYLLVSWSGERMKLSAELGFELGFGFSSESVMTLESDSSVLQKNGIEINESSFGFNPTLSLGMQWAIVPEKLFLNAGGCLSFGNIKLITVESSEFENGGKKDGTSEKEVNDTFSSAQTELSLGLTFNVTRNVSVQANCGIASNNVVNLFKSDSVGGSGLAVFTGILATVQF